MNGKPIGHYLSPGLITTGGHGGAVYSRSVIRLLERSEALSAIKIVNVRGAGHGYAGRMERMVNLARSVLTNIPERMLSTVSRAGQRLAEDAAKDPNCVAFFDQSGVLGIQTLFSGSIARVFVCHALEHEMLRDRIEVDRSLPAWLKPVLSYDAKKLEEFERAAAAGVEGIWCISARDADWWRLKLPSVRVISVPPTFAGPLDTTRSFELSSDRPLRLGFLGSLRWWPNREAVDWMINHILPSVHGRAELHLFGGDAQGRGRDAGLVKTHGFVADINEVWRGIDIAVCPIRNGGGSNVKFAEGIFRGVPTLATRYAARGLPTIVDGAVVYLDSAQDWVNFLRSDAARALARSRPTEASRMTFADATYQPTVSAFLQSLLAR